MCQTTTHIRTVARLALATKRPDLTPRPDSEAHRPHIGYGAQSLHIEVMRAPMMLITCFDACFFTHGFPGAVGDLALHFFVAK